MLNALADDKLVRELVARMTVAEKTAQLCCTYVPSVMTNGVFDPEAARRKIPNGIGHLVSTADPKAAEAVADFQAWLRHNTRLGIPAIIHGESITGTPLLSATTLPQQIGMSCTWNPGLLESNTVVTRRQMRRVGMNQALSPMVETGNEARWGRNEESFGEDPYLAGTMAVAFIKGLQGDDLRQGVAATAKHFAGFAQMKVVNGKCTYEMSVQGETNLVRFREDILTPFEMAVKLGQVASIMPGYSSVDGVPCHGSTLLLRDILRGEWGFQGDVISDYHAIKYTQPHWATNQLDALRKCLEAGVDVDLPDAVVYQMIPEALASGVISQQLLDEAVIHLLKAKARLGLLDADTRFADLDDRPEFDSPADRQRAYISACQSLVLLKNDGVLPVSVKVHSIALIGPNADSAYSLLGDYTMQSQSEFWSRVAVNPDKPKLVTLLSGVTNRAGKLNIAYERGCDWAEGLTLVPGGKEVFGDEGVLKASKHPMLPQPQPDWNRALDLARKCDLIIAAMGENRYLCGESCDRYTNIRLPGRQEELIRALAATGKPVVLVLFGGRPNALGDIEPLCRAIVQAWYPGEEGGNAVADALLGNINFSGKLTLTMPRTTAQCPISHRLGYDANNPPLYPFGHGLSYTTFKYDGLTVPPTVATGAKEFSAEFSLANSGTREGAEVAQLYVTFPDEAQCRPPLELKGFARVSLKPHETSHVTIRIPMQMLAAFNPEKRVWEICPGRYQIKVGASSSDIRLKTEILMTGDSVTMPQRTEFMSQTSVVSAIDLPNTPASAAAKNFK